MKTKNDAELFFIKHLLILREQIAPFNNEFSVVEVQLDFSRIKDAAFGLLNKKDSIFRLNRDNAFLDFLLNVSLFHFITLINHVTKSFGLKGTLEARENLIDSKREVDNHLKKSCESLIDNVSEDLFGNIKQLVKQVRTSVSTVAESITDKLTRALILV